MKQLEDTDSASTPEAAKRLQYMRKILVGRLRDSKAAAFQLSFLGASVEPSRIDDQAAFFAPVTTGQSRVSVGVAICHPFSQGSVRISSSEPSRPPWIDPAYMIGTMDLEATSIGLRIADEVMKTNPLAQKI
jgi:choline dehydrogenase-like flavoprotein